jgi:hypothetical protein
MTYVTSWTEPTLSSGTAGTIANATYNPSMMNSSEYSTIASLFTEIKLLRYQIVFSPKAQSLSSASQGQLIIGTNIQFTYSTYTTPTAFSQVQNLAKRTIITSARTNSFVYEAWVPRDLEFAIITADSPVSATPWAGSPGAVVVFGNAFTPVTAYFDVTITAQYQLRGRV